MIARYTHYVSTAIINYIVLLQLSDHYRLVKALYNIIFLVKHKM